MGPPTLSFEIATCYQQSKCQQLCIVNLVDIDTHAPAFSESVHVMR